ncbi:hypothetical protein ACHAW6_005173, partial [Cyclotella cf. meneghiniana]
QQQQQQQQQQASTQCRPDDTIRGLRGFLLPAYLSMRCVGSSLPRGLCEAKKRAGTTRRGARGNVGKTGGCDELKLAAWIDGKEGNGSRSSNAQENDLWNGDRRTVGRKHRKRRKCSADNQERDPTINDEQLFHYRVMARMVVAPYTPYLIDIMNDLASADPTSTCEHSDKKSNISTDFTQDAIVNTPTKAASASTSAKSYTVRNVYAKPENARPPTSTRNAIRMSSPRESLESLVDGVVGALVQRTHTLRHSVASSSANHHHHRGGKSSSNRSPHRRRKRKRNPPSANAAADDPPKTNRSSANDWLRVANILSAGYSLGAGETLPSSFEAAAKKPKRDQTVRHCPNMPPGVHCIRPNSVTTYARSSGLMRALHSSVGDEVLAEILLNAVVLVPVVDDDGSSNAFERGNYFQLCGPPLNIVAKRFEKIEPERDDRGASCVAERDRGQTSEWNPNRSIPRYKLFYCEFYAGRVGLSPGHVLNRSKWDDSNAAAVAGTKRKISCNTGGALPAAKHEMELLDEMVQLWPKSGQSWNNSNKNGGGVVYCNKRRARWRRLRENGIKMCKEIIRRHGQCDYARLLEKHCPLLLDDKNDPRWRKKRHEFHSKEELSHLVTLFTPSDAVGKFLEAVLRKAFPSAFWGSKHNFFRFIKTLNVFLNLRLTESFPEKLIVEGIRTLDMKWLHSPSAKSHSSSGKPKLSRSGHESCVILLRNVMRWIYCQYITPLLRSTFYITDTEFTGRRVVYYRRPVWTRIRSLSLDTLLKRQYRERSLVKAQKILSTHNVGCPPAPLRLLPKKTGIRAIAMLSKACAIEDNTGAGAVVAAKSTRQRSMLSPNKILQSTFHALKYEYRKRPSLFGAGALGVTELFQPFCLFLEALRKKSAQFSCKTPVTDTSSTAENPLSSHGFQLYFTSADIQHCYDSINQEHLYKQVRSVVQEDCYVTQNHFVIHSTGGRRSSTRCRWQKTTCSPDEVLGVVSKSKKLSEKFLKSIFVDGVNCSVEKRHTILGLLKDHIFGQMIVAKGNLGQRMLLQRNGIPQGSILSSLFCNAYFGNVEDLMFDGVFDKDSIVIMGSHANRSAILLESPSALHLLFRIVDDFLLISTDLDTSRRFLNRINRGVTRLGVKVNPDKTRVNYNSLQETEQINTANTGDPNKDTNVFPWCGLLINTKTCEISLDHERFCGSLATDNVTVHRSGKEGSALLKKMQDFVKPRCHQQLLFSSFINSPNTVRVNFYQTFMICAIKTTHYLKTAGVNMSPKKGDFVYNAVCDTIHYAFLLISSRTRDTSGQAARNEFASKLSLKDAFWLGKRAFYTVIGRESGFKHLRRLFREVRSETVGNRKDLVLASKRGLDSWPLYDL